MSGRFVGKVAIVTGGAQGPRIARSLPEVS